MQVEVVKDSPSSDTDASKSSEMPSEAKTKECTSLTGSKSQFYTSAAEYHVYEEITYDLVGDAPVFKALDAPPPLPARPTSMVIKPDHLQWTRTPSPPPRRSRSALKKGPQNLVGAHIEIRNKPKQRGNLYCLFADRAERRNISRSLEREVRVSGTEVQDDDYGFRKDFISI